MGDTFTIALGAGLAASSVGGPGLAYAVERAPDRWRRTIEWTVVCGACAITVVASLASDAWSPGLVFVMAALPGLLTYLAWRTVLASTLVAITPLYFVIAQVIRTRPMHVPALALDVTLPLRPWWMLVYGSLYVLVLLPLFVVRDPRVFRRTLMAYLLVWIAAFAVFLVYPTVTSRPAIVPGDGFAAWYLRLIYSLDTPYNCFPSLHVAQSFVAAFACHKVSKSVGSATLIWASLVGISTLYTKQHYVADVVAGALLGCIGYGLCLRSFPREAIDPQDRRLAAPRAAWAVAVFGLLTASVWCLYATGIVL